MVLYSMSPRAYHGLIALAQDPYFCPDYARLLRYLDVAVSVEEAKLLGTGSPDSHSPSWIQVAFLDSAEVIVPSNPPGAFVTKN